MSMTEQSLPERSPRVRAAAKRGWLRWRGTALLLATFSATAHAGPIEEAVRKGLLISPEIRAAQAQESAAGTDVSIAKGGYYPTVSVSGGPLSLVGSSTDYQIDAAQLLYDWGRVASTVKSARAAQRRLSEQVREKREEVALDIVEVYLDVLVTQRQIAGLETHIADLDNIRQMTVTRAGGGYADRSEPERATLELARAREQLAIERGTLEDARHRYRLLVGEDPTQLEDPAPASVSAYVARNDMTALLEAAPAYRAATEDTRSAEAKVKEARASLFPQLNLEASTLRRDIGGTSQADSIVALRLRMSNMQFSNFLRPKGARQRLEAATWNERYVARDLRNDVQGLFDNARMLREREETLDVQVSSSTALGETYLEQFRVGRRDLIDLLNTRREAFDAKRQLIATHIDRFRVEYRAAAKLGLIGPLLEKGLY